jgi:N-acetylglutamate synthase-like GNAT family acetyltransferase
MVWAFWGYEESGTLAGVMGIQQVQDVTLIRHAYVRTGNQKRGIGAHLLSHLPVPMNQFRQRKHLTNIHRHMKCSQTQEQ